MSGGFSRRGGNRRSQFGLSLIELMIGMTLGLVILGALLYVFAGNRASYRHQESLSLVQESGRLALEILARDIREAGFAGCGHGVTLRDATNPTQSANFNALNNFTVGATANDPDSFSIRRGAPMNDLVRVNSFAANTIVVDDASGFSQLTSVLLTDCVAAQVLTIPLNGVNYGTNTITVNEALGAWTGASSFMTLVPLIDVAYSVDVGTEQILRAGDAIASGVRNMKIEYGVDTTVSPYNHDVTAYQANPADIADVVAMRVVLTIGDGVGANRVELDFPTTMTMRNRVADRP